MFKIATIAALVALISACSSMPAGSMAGNSGMSRTTMGAPGTGMGNGVVDSYGSGGGGPN
jgi:hypothetical protein